MKAQEAIVVVSGGMDSVTLAYHLRAEGYALHLLGFNYGQRHVRELDSMRSCARALEASSEVRDLSDVFKAMSTSSLTGSKPVPHGHYAEESMRDTVVPNRNAIMFNIAAGIAISRGAQAVGVGVHAGDHFIYPDCRPSFIEALQHEIDEGNEGFNPPRILAPFLMKTKAQICSRGTELGVPWAETWSCYEGGAVHCGRCGTCVERVLAFREAGVPDPTIYADSTYALSVTAPTSPALLASGSS